MFTIYNLLEQIGLIFSTFACCAMISFVEKYLVAIKSCQFNKYMRKCVASLTKRLNEIQPCLYAFSDDSSKCFYSRLKMDFLLCNCIFFPIIKSMNFNRPGDLIFLMNKISHSYWAWEIFLV